MERQYNGQERRIRPVSLTPEQIDHIAERAAEVALEKVYTSVGKTVVGKVLWLAGAAGIAVSVWVNAHGIPLGK